MGYIELKGLDGIPGLNSKERDKYFKERESAILADFPSITDDEIDELYLNYKINNTYGSDALNGLSSLEDKVSFWQNNYPSLDKASQTYMGFNRYQTPYDSDAPKPDESNWFNRNVLNATGDKLYYDLQEWFEASSGVVRDLTDEDSNAIILDSYGTYEGDFKNNPNYIRDVKSYSKELKDLFYQDRILAASHFKNFVDLATEKSYYFKNYYGSPYLPLSIDSAENLMAEYYAIKELGNEEEADIFLNRTIQNLAEKNQSLPDKIAATVGATAANMVGNVAVWTGLLLNAPMGMWGSMAKNWDIEGINGLEEFLYYSANNDLVKWGNNLMTTGFYNPKTQELAKQTGFNKNLLIKTYEESNGNFAQDFFNLETFLEAVSQMGFTYAGATEAVASRYIAKAVSKPVNKLAAKALASEAKNLAAVLTKVEDGIMLAVPAFSAAYAEGSMEAFGLSENFMDNVDNLTRDHIYDNYYEDYFNQNYQQPTLRIPTEGSPLTQEEVALAQQHHIDEQVRIREQFEKEYVDKVLNSEEYKNYVNRMNAQIISSTTWKNTLWIGAGDALITRMLGPAITEARHRLFGVKGSGQFKEVVEDGITKVVATKQTGIAVLKGAKDVVWEGVEEGGQSITANVEEAIANNNVLKFIDASINGKSIEDLNDSFFNNLSAVGDAIGQSFKDKETWKSFMMGALSTGMGRLSPGQAIRTMANTNYSKYQMLGSSKWNMAKDMLSSLYYNPIVDAVKEANSDYAQAKADAEFFNSWISEEANREMVKSMGGVVSFVEKTRQALHEGNEKDYRDTQLASTLRILRMFDKFEGTSYYNSLNSYIETLSNIDTANQETKNRVLEYARPHYSGLQSTDEDIISNVKRHAEEMRTLWNKSKELYSSIESEFGRAIDSDTKEAIVYGLIGVEDWKTRLQQLNKDIAVFSDKKSTTSSEIANAVARIGNVENGKVLLEKAKERLNSKRAISAKNSTISKEYKKQEIAKAKKEIKQIKNDLKTLENVDTNAVRLSRADILGLNSVERNNILTNKNLKKYLSEGTVESIENILNDNTITSDVHQKIKDAAEIQKDIDYHNEFLANLRRSKDAAALLGYEIKANGIVKNLTRRVQNFIGETNYDTFKQKLTEFLELNVLSDFEKSQLGKVFRGNPNYMKYSIAKAIKTAQHETATSTAAYQNIPQKYVKIIKAIIRDIYEGEGFKSTDYARNLLMDGGFLAKEGLSLEDFTPEDIDSIVDIIGEVIKQTDNLIKEAKAKADAKIDNNEEPVKQPEVTQPIEQPELEEEKPEPKEELNEFVELGSISVLEESEITSEKQKEFYARNEVSKVLEALQEKYNGNMGLSQDEFVILIDETFIGEKDSFDSDNYPIAVAVVVDDTFKGPFKEVEGKKVAIIGLAKNSRESKDDKLNTLNRLRRQALNDSSNETFLLKDTNGLVTFKGAAFNVTYNKQPTNMPSNRLMESLIMMHGGDMDAALQDFLEHTHYATVAQTDTEGKEKYVYKKRTLYYTDKSGRQKSIEADTYYGKALLYINGDTVLVLGTRNDYTLSDESSIYDHLINENAEELFDRNYKDELGFIKELLVSLATQLSKREVINSLSDPKKLDFSDLEKELNKRVGRYLNLLKYSDSVEGLLRIKVTKGTFADKESIILSVDSDNESNRWELANIPLDALPQVEKRKGALSIIKSNLYKDFSPELKSGLIEAVRKLIFHEDGSVRRYTAQNGNEVAIIKPQVSDAFFSDEEYASKIFYSNLLYIVETSTSSANQLQINNEVKSKKPGEPSKTKKEIITNGLMNLHTQTKETRFDKSEYTSVSEFIDETSNSVEETNESIAEHTETGETKKVDSNSKDVKFEIGTSLDSFLKLWFSPEVNQDVDKLSKYLEANKIGSWDFLTRGNSVTIGGTMGKFIREANKLSTFLKNRGETVISFGALEELELFAELTAEDGKTKKIRGIPDLITVDANGGIHIYDYKTFTQKEVGGTLTSPRFDGFNNGPKGFTVSGNTETFGGLFDKYKRQLTLYKALIEAALPGAEVVSLGIIPIGVDYNKDEELVYSETRHPITKAHKVTKADGKPFNIKGVQMFNDAIKVEPLPLSQVSSTKWGESKDSPVKKALDVKGAESHSPVKLENEESKGAFERRVKDRDAQQATIDDILSGIADDIFNCIPK